MAPPSPSAVGTVASSQAPLTPKAQVFKGPRRFSEPGGICVDVPEGARGIVLPAPDILRLVQPTFEILYTHSKPANAPPEGYELVFMDDDTYQSIPWLQGTGSFRWSNPDPTSERVEGWFGDFRGQPLTVLVEIKPRAPFNATEAALKLVSSSCATPP